MRPAIALLLLASLAPAQADEPVSAEVFTDSGIYRLANAQGAVVYDLSAPNRLNLGLDSGLPRNQEAALAMAKARIASNSETIRSAYAGYGKAAQYQIAKIPAVVFGHGEAVVYGATDVAEALTLYRRWKHSGDKTR